MSYGNDHPLKKPLESIELQARDAKAIIEELLYLLDHQHKAPWPDMMSKFGALASAMSKLENDLKKGTLIHGRDDLVTMLRSHLFVPQMLDFNTDSHLQEITQGRVQAYHHDLVPDYLRTKADTEHEKEEAAIEAERSNRSYENTVSKQIAQMNRNVDSLLAVAGGPMDNRQTDTVDQQLFPSWQPTFNRDETLRLARAVCLGIGLERQRQMAPPSAAPGGMPGPSAATHGVPPGMHPGVGPPGAHMPHPGMPQPGYGPGMMGHGMGAGGPGVGGAPPPMGMRPKPGGGW